jgi:hypothetical protein
LQNVIQAIRDLKLANSDNNHPVCPAKPPLEIDLRAYSASEVDVQIGSGHDLLGWAVQFGTHSRDFSVGHRTSSSDSLGAALGELRRIIRSSD